MKPSTSSRANSLALLSRIAAAIFGGYLLATAVTILLGAVLPLPKGQAVLAGSLASFAVYTAAIIWAFAEKSLKRVWIGMLVMALVFTALGMGIVLIGGDR